MLEKVFYIHNDDRWEPISPYKAIQRYPDGLTSHRREFICGTCGQPVSLVTYNGTPFFRHPVGSKDCMDKIVSSYSGRQLLELEYSLPLRMNVSSSQLDIQIGFLPIPSVLMECAIKKNALVAIYDQSDVLIREYSISLDRLSTETTTFLSIGGNISRHYLLKISQIGISCWPQIVDGVNVKGTLFDEKTGRRLQSQASVALNKKYWLLSKPMVVDLDGVSVTHMMKYDQWNLFEIEVSRYSVDAMEFFSKFDVILGETDLELVQLWPPLKRSSVVVNHFGENLWFYKSKGHAVIHPMVKQFSDESQVICIEKTHEQQVLSICRNEKSSKVQQYVYIRFTELNISDIQHIRNIEVLDANGISIPFGEYSMLPIKNELKVQTMFNGFVQVERNGVLIDQIQIKANEQLRINVRFNHTYCLYQGLDCVGEVVFSRCDTVVERVDDHELLQMVMRCSGNLIAAKHSLGTMAMQMKDLPKTRLWLLKCLRSGIISADAVKLLHNRLRGIKYV